MWALIQNGVVIEITGIDPAGRFHESIAWASCGSDVQVGWIHAGETFAPPEDNQQPTQEELLTGVKNEIRVIRSPMLDALTGIAGRAVRAGNDTLAAEADELANALLDITDDVALNEAATYEEMQSAKSQAFARISLAAGDDLRTVFREITGS